MNTFLKNKWKLMAVAEFSLIVIWLSHLANTDSYFSVYALCCAVSVLCLYDNYIQCRHLTKGKFALSLILSCLLSLTVALSNYPIFQRIRNVHQVSSGTNTALNYLEAVLTFVGGIVLFYQIMLWVVSRYPAESKEEAALPSGKHPGRVFGSVFGSLSLIYLIYLFFVVYPGSVTSDSIWQIGMIVSGNHTNHHPYWHTMSIQWLLNLGYALFRDPNAAAATFSAVQSFGMAACFAYAIATLYQRRVPKMWIWIVYAMFAVLPCHITYSCTMWKDVPFGGAVLVLVVAMFRIVRKVGKNRALNYVMLMIGGIGTGILRSNGLYAMLAAFVVLVLFFWKRCRELILPWFVCLLVGWFLTGPAMTMLGVRNVNYIEALSVPIQQVARVITNGGDLTAEETALLENIVDLEEIPELYDEQCCDQVKDEIKLKNYYYIQEHMGEFARLWIDIGMRYPWEYVEAWVEETKGYWNGGYDYYIYAQYVSENRYGFYMVEQNNLIHDLVKAYFTLTRETVLFEPFQSIGLHVWILSILCFLNLMYGRKEFLLTVPVLAVVFTLWLTTPVFAEFRYAYSIFTTIPFILPVSLHSDGVKDNQE